MMSNVLTSGVIAAVVAAIVAYVTGRTQATAAVRAGREQAIETEKLRLEFSLVEQRLRLFFARAEALAALVANVPINVEGACRFFSSMPFSSQLLSLAADRLIGEDYVRLAGPVLQAAEKECNCLFDLLMKHRPDEAPPTDQVTKEIADSSCRSLIALHQLMRAADVLAEAALRRNDAKDYAKRLAAIQIQTERVLAGGPSDAGTCSQQS